MNEDKRLYQRLIVKRPANRDFSNPSPSGPSTIILDIGPEGIGFTVDENMEIGTYVFLDIDLGDGVQVALSVQILWLDRIGDSEHFRAGGKIRDAKKEDLEKFVRFYCEQLIPVKSEERKLSDSPDHKSNEDTENNA